MFWVESSFRDANLVAYLMQEKAKTQQKMQEKRVLQES